MDPVTIFLYGIAIAIGGLVAHEVLKPLIVVSKNKIIETYRSYFEKRSILILGGPKSGKTSLILYLTRGKPYIEKDGQRHSADKTVGIAVIDETALDSLGIPNIGHLERILKDVGGEFTDQWKQLIREINPHGIIYMINGTHNEEQLTNDVRVLFDHVLSQYPTDTRNLRTVHIFVNFADLLDLAERHDKPYTVALIIKKRMSYDLNKHLAKVKIDVISTQLASNQNDWPEVKLALQKFGSALR